VHVEEKEKILALYEKRLYLYISLCVETCLFSLLCLS